MKVCFFFRVCLLLLHLTWLLSRSEVVAVPMVHYAALGRAVSLVTYSEISLLGCLRSVAPWWTCGMCPVPMPKKGCGELLSPPDCTLAPGTLWDVAVLTAAWNMK